MGFMGLIHPNLKDYTTEKERRFFRYNHCGDVTIKRMRPSMKINTIEEGIHYEAYYHYGWRTYAIEIVDRKSGHQLYNKPIDKFPPEDLPKGITNNSIYPLMIAHNLTKRI